MSSSRSDSIPERLSREEVNALPLIRFEGSIRIAEDAKTVNRLADRLRKERVLGFDVESKPTFKRGPTNPPALLQLSTADRAYLIRLLPLKRLGALKALLEDPKVVKTGVALRDDLINLRRMEEFKPRGFEELATLAASLGVVQTGLRSLSAIFLSRRISKSAQLSNWERVPLSRGQVSYAATDAWISREIYLIMKARLDRES